MFVAPVCLLAFGCRQPEQPVDSPERTYQAIERTFLSGDLLKAQKDSEAALHRYMANDPLWSARFRVELAKVLLYEGHSAEVVALLDPAPSEGTSLEIAVQQNLLVALARNYLGQQSLSDDALARAAARHPEGTLQAEVVGAQGTIAMYRGDLGVAEHLLQLALNTAQQGKDTMFLQVRMWNNLGVVALKQEHYEDALARFNHVSFLAQTLGDRPHLVKALINLGWVYSLTGDLTRALQNEQLAATQAAASGASLDEMQALINAGMIQSQMGDTVAALAPYQRALALAELLQNPEMLGSVHTELAYLLLRSDPAGAAGHIREAALLARQRKDSAEEQLEASLLEGLLLAQQGKIAEAETGLLAVVQRASGSPWVRWTSENILAGLYAEADHRHDAELWYERAIDTFHRQRNSVSDVEMQLPFLENGSDLYLTYMEYLIRQHRTDEALAVLDRSRAEILAQGLHQAAGGDNTRSQRTSVPPRAVAARLHATILVYCLRPRGSYLWAIDAKREEFHELPGSETILPLVDRHTQAILTSKELLTQKDSTGAALYDALIRPAQALLPPGGRVFLIADKGLGGLNFETLIPPGAQPHYWIDDVSMTNARSLRLLAAADRHAEVRSAGRMLLIGDPVYRTEEYNPLPNAAAEMTSVASHFAPDQRSVFSGPQATPAAYNASGAGRFAYVHFVAHATADAVNPLGSAIILSHPADRSAPYKLYASDILKQPLDAELVTLSSCYGSGTRNYSGEGVVGLVWAFLRAGAHSVIGAMWEVSDVSTPKLMDAMYGQLLRGDQPDAALRSAKLAMVHGNGIYRKPLYWASFQLYAGR